MTPNTFFLGSQLNRKADAAFTKIGMIMYSNVEQFFAPIDINRVSVA